MADDDLYGSERRRSAIRGMGASAVGRSLGDDRVLRMDAPRDDRDMPRLPIRPGYSPTSRNYRTGTRRSSRRA